MVIIQPERMITDLLEDYDMHTSLVLELNANDDWKTVAKEFGFFSTSDIRRFEQNLSPSDAFLAEIGVRECTVGGLCEILELCQLDGALSLLSEPEPLMIKEQPNDPVFVPVGGELQLKIIAKGNPPPQYVWYHGNEELFEQRSNILSIDDFGPQYEGEYVCFVTQEGSEITIQSNYIVVEILPEKPFIETQPSPVACRIGDEVTLSCVCEGYPLPNFQWMFGNTVLQGENSNTLTIPYADSSDDGVYKVYISNKGGEVYSDPVRISVYEYEESESLEDEYQTKWPRLKDEQQMIYGSVTGCQTKLIKEKVALLIANENYTNLSPLRTPANDVTTLSAILKHLGFKVLALLNLTLVQMRSAVREFCKMLPEGSYAIFYFVGHGFDMYGKYMVPVDSPEPDSYLRSECLCDGEVVKDILATDPKLLLIFLDMCLITPSKELNPGLYEEEIIAFSYKPRRNLIRGYATTTGLKAYEKCTEDNGIYMKHLKKFLPEDCPIVKILEKVNESMSNESKDVADLQIPSYTNNVVVGLHYLTNQAEENEQTKALYEKYTTPMLPKTILFKLVKTQATVRFSLHRNCFQNVVEIVIKNLENWLVDLQTYCKELKLRFERKGTDILITVLNLQEIKIPTIALIITLKDRHTNTMKDNAILELDENPLIASAQLWYNPCLIKDTDYM